MSNILNFDEYRIKKACRLIDRNIDKRENEILLIKQLKEDAKTPVELEELACDLDSKTIRHPLISASYEL